MSVLLDICLVAEDRFFPKHIFLPDREYDNFLCLKGIINKERKDFFMIVQLRVVK